MYPSKAWMYSGNRTQAAELSGISVRTCAICFNRLPACRAIRWYKGFVGEGEILTLLPSR
jgi:hypothetical protein